MVWEACKIPKPKRQIGNERTSQQKCFQHVASFGPELIFVVSQWDWDVWRKQESFGDEAGLCSHLSLKNQSQKSAQKRWLCWMIAKIEWFFCLWTPFRSKRSVSTTYFPTNGTYERIKNNCDTVCQTKAERIGTRPLVLLFSVTLLRGACHTGAQRCRRWEFSLSHALFMKVESFSL